MTIASKNPVGIQPLERDADAGLLAIADEIAQDLSEDLLGDLRIAGLEARGGRC